MLGVLFFLFIQRIKEVSVFSWIFKLNGAGGGKHRLAEQELRSGSWSRNKPKLKEPEDQMDKQKYSRLCLIPWGGGGVCLFEWEARQNVLFRLSHIWVFQNAIISDELIICFGTIFVIILFVNLQIKCFPLLSSSYLPLGRPNVCVVKSVIHYNLLLHN